MSTDNSFKSPVYFLQVHHMTDGDYYVYYQVYGASIKIIKIERVSFYETSTAAGP